MAKSSSGSPEEIKLRLSEVSPPNLLSDLVWFLDRLLEGVVRGPGELELEVGITEVVEEMAFSERRLAFVFA